MIEQLWRLHKRNQFYNHKWWLYPFIILTSSWHYCALPIHCNCWLLCYSVSLLLPISLWISLLLQYMNSWDADYQRCVKCSHFRMQEIFLRLYVHAYPAYAVLYTDWNARDTQLATWEAIALWWNGYLSAVTWPRDYTTMKDTWTVSVRTYNIGVFKGPRLILFYSFTLNDIIQRKLLHQLRNSIHCSLSVNYHFISVGV